MPSLSPPVSSSPLMPPASSSRRRAAAGCGGAADTASMPSSPHAAGPFIDADSLDRTVLPTSVQSFPRPLIPRRGPAWTCVDLRGPRSNSSILPNRETNGPAKADRVCATQATTATVRRSPPSPSRPSTRPSAARPSATSSPRRLLLPPPEALAEAAAAVPVEARVVSLSPRPSRRSFRSC